MASSGRLLFSVGQVRKKAAKFKLNGLLLALLHVTGNNNNGFMQEKKHLSAAPDQISSFDKSSQLNSKNLQMFDSFSESLIVKVITSFIFPYLLLYGLYIQANGEVSPGGGFQAGVIFASSMIAASLMQRKQEFFSKMLSYDQLIAAAVIGVLIYAGTGLISLFTGDHYLNYYSLSLDKILPLTLPFNKAQIIMNDVANNLDTIQQNKSLLAIDNHVALNFPTLHQSQAIGIATIEIGVGITVSAVMSFIYAVFYHLATSRTLK